MKYILLGAINGVILVAVGIRSFSWQWWLLIAWILTHTLIWSYFDKRERGAAKA